MGVLKNQDDFDEKLTFDAKMPYEMCLFKKGNFYRLFFPEKKQIIEINYRICWRHSECFLNHSDY